jgi:hypothetical protein
MAERKQTPDILSEILTGAANPPPLPVKAAAPRAAPQAREKPAGKPSPKPAQPVQKKKTQYEYEVVSFQEHRGWRSRFVNGREVPDWMSAPLIHECVQQRAADGWELVTATSGEQLYALSDKRQLFFRRERES